MVVGTEGRADSRNNADDPVEEASLAMGDGNDEPGSSARIHLMPPDGLSDGGWIGGATGAFLVGVWVMTWNLLLGMVFTAAILYLVGVNSERMERREKGRLLGEFNRLCGMMGWPPSESFDKPHGDDSTQVVYWKGDKQSHHRFTIYLAGRGRLRYTLDRTEIHGRDGLEVTDAVRERCDVFLARWREREIIMREVQAGVRPDGSHMPVVTIFPGHYTVDDLKDFMEDLEVLIGELVDGDTDGPTQVSEQAGQ